MISGGVIEELSEAQGLPEGEYLKSLVFIHIPVGEYQTAYDELITDIKNEKGELTGFEMNPNPENTVFLEGSWDEKKVYFGGISNTDTAPEDQDELFEVLSEDMHSAEGYFCGHDHVNNGVVLYKGVMLCYNYTIDNIAYGNEISAVGSQRGCSIITVSPDGSFTQQHKNAYRDYGCDPDIFVHVDVEGYYAPEIYRTYEH